jgi:leader peptidase (prepilin peptidase)/N-methyltransferase
VSEFFAALIGGGVGTLLSMLGREWVKRLTAGRAPSGYWRVFFILGSAWSVVFLTSTLGWSVRAGLSCVFLWSLMLLTLIDVETFLLPDRLTLPLIALGFVWAMVSPQAELSHSLLGAGFGYGVLWLVDFVYERASGRAGMGRGDFKLMAALGAWCGVAALPSLILGASLLGACVALVGLVFGRLNRHSAIPFGPCLALSGALSFLRVGG